MAVIHWKVLEGLVSWPRPSKGHQPTAQYLHHEEIAQQQLPMRAALIYTAWQMFWGLK